MEWGTYSTATLVGGAKPLSTVATGPPIKHLIQSRPARLISPTVDSGVTRPFKLAECSSEPEVSVPIEAAHRPAATATAELDPPGDTTGMP
ncbi:protein of unknown function [Bradyrhizobium vignae]|uniref:Uncharacterized protein n=1 Tax=Bradyrhizobium vignae TaxID=1549949 RepID=A0A2U3Q4T0_9BRAD|nr:protein of unknown function [Bradyrhizobium vignae]